MLNHAVMLYSEKQKIITFVQTIYVKQSDKAYLFVFLQSLASSYIARCLDLDTYLFYAFSLINFSI